MKASEFFDIGGFFLSLVWLLILCLELVGEPSPLFFHLGTLVWATLVVQFLAKFFWTKDKRKFIEQYFLFSLAIAIPALRFTGLGDEYKWVRLLTATSAVQLVWIFGSIGLSMHTLKLLFRQNGTALVTALTSVVTFVGGAALFHYENPVSGPGLHSYTEALWWTAMQLTTIGSGYSPQTPQGQVIALAISIYACGVFGFITAELARFFIGQDAAHPSRRPSSQESVNLLHEELRALKEEFRSFAGKGRD